jgi:plastocyanin
MVALRVRSFAVIVAGLFTSLLAGCGSSSNSAPTTPTTPTNPNVVTITSTGVSPKTINISLGNRVTFVNNDSRTHNMFSDPHPEHTDCPEINQVGFLTPGQSRDTGNFVVARSCGFHDHDDPLTTSLQGTIIIK